MPDNVNLESAVLALREPYAMIAHPQTQFAGLSSELSDIALASLGKTMECGEDAHRSFTVESANIGTSILGPYNSSHVGPFRVFGPSGVKPNSPATSS